MSGAGCLDLVRTEGNTGGYFGLQDCRGTGLLAAKATRPQGTQNCRVCRLQKAHATEAKIPEAKDCRCQVFLYLLVMWGQGLTSGRSDSVTYMSLSH